MPITLYNFKLKRELPLLSDDEYRPIERALIDRLEEIKEYRHQHQASLEEAKRHTSDDALDFHASRACQKAMIPESVSTPKATSSVPEIRWPQAPTGAVFSISTKAAMAATQARFMMPTAKSTIISAQQQPTQ